MVDFAGYWMPVQYEGVLAEHRRVREQVGLFDISHMAEFHLRGGNARLALDSLITNNLSRLEPQRVLYTALCREGGGVLDDLLVYCLSGDHFLVVANAANREKVAKWLRDRLPPEVDFADESDSTALIAIQGPSSLELLLRWPRGKEIAEGLRELEYYHTLQPVFADSQCILSRTGYTGEKGFELYLPSSCAVGLLGGAPAGRGRAFGGASGSGGSGYAYAWRPAIRSMDTSSTKITLPTSRTSVGWCG